MPSTSVGARILVHLCAALLVLTVLWQTSSSCSAALIVGDAVPLSELAGNPQADMVVGDKRFTDFTYNVTGDMPGAAGVNVIPIQDDDGNFGIRFQGAFVDLPSSQGGSDALITYSVEVTDPLRLISDAHLAGNPALLGDSGSISVTETFLPLGPNGEFTMTIFDDDGGSLPKLIDWVDFAPPVRRLNVQKDILAIAVPDDRTVTMSFVDQTFSQIVIPEPVSLLLVMTGCVGLVAMARRRSV